jgi:hypothetical protein
VGDHTDRLVATCYDWDFADAHDRMGAVAVDLRDLLDQVSPPRHVPPHWTRSRAACCSLLQSVAARLQQAATSCIRLQQIATERNRLHQPAADLLEKDTDGKGSGSGSGSGNPPTHRTP